MDVLMMLITSGVLISAAGLLAFAIWTKKTWLKSFVLGGVLIWFASYAILMFAASIISQETLVAPNDAEQFCGFYLDYQSHL